MLDAQLARDAGLRRLRRVNRWIGVASVAITGALTDVVANAFPGHSIKRGAGSQRYARATVTTASQPAVTKHPIRHHRRIRPHLDPPAPVASAAPVQSAPVQPAPVQSAPVQSAAPAPTPAPAPVVAPPPAPAPVVSGGS